MMGYVRKSNGQTDRMTNGQTDFYQELSVKRNIDIEITDRHNMEKCGDGQTYCLSVKS